MKDNAFIVNDSGMLHIPKYDCYSHGQIDCVITFTTDREGWKDARQYCALCFEDLLIERGALVNEPMEKER